MYTIPSSMTEIHRLDIGCSVMQLHELTAQAHPTVCCIPLAMNWMTYSLATWIVSCTWN